METAINIASGPFLCMAPSQDSSRRCVKDIYSLNYSERHRRIIAHSILMGAFTGAVL